MASQRCSLYPSKRVQFAHHLVEMKNSVDGIALRAVFGVTGHEFQHRRIAGHAAQLLHRAQSVEHHRINVARFQVVDRHAAQRDLVARFQIGEHAAALHSTPKVGLAVEGRIHVEARSRRLIVFQFVESAGEIAVEHRQALRRRIVRRLFLRLTIRSVFGTQHAALARNEPIDRNAESGAHRFEEIIFRLYSAGQIGTDTCLVCIEQFGKSRVASVGKPFDELFKS